MLPSGTLCFISTKSETQPPKQTSWYLSAKRLEPLDCFASNTLHFQLIQKKTTIYHVKGFTVIYQHHATNYILI